MVLKGSEVECSTLFSLVAIFAVFQVFNLSPASKCIECMNTPFSNTRLKNLWKFDFTRLIFSQVVCRKLQQQLQVVGETKVKQPAYYSITGVSTCIVSCIQLYRTILNLQWNRMCIENRYTLNTCYVLVQYIIWDQSLLSFFLKKALWTCAVKPRRYSNTQHSFEQVMITGNMDVDSKSRSDHTIHSVDYVLYLIFDQKLENLRPLCIWTEL